MDRLRWASLIGIALVTTTGATCNKNNDGDVAASASATADAVPRVELEGIDTQSLTPREHQDWSRQVSALLSPCSEVAVPVAQCVKEKRDCALCVPAAEFLLRMVQAGLSTQEVAELYAARFDPKEVKTIVIGDSPRKGASDAPVTMVEFADFECGGCRDAFPLIERVYAKYGKKMQLVYKHYPLEFHPNAKLAAQAAWAAQQQNQFWRMHKILFERQERLTEPDLFDYAREIGLDLKRFQKDLHSEAAKQAVEKERSQGESLGVTQTPTIFVNGRELPSKLPSFVRDLEDWIELEIRHAGHEVPSGVTAPVEGPTAPSQGPGEPNGTGTEGAG
jgi:protein-disulfide isomerase